MTDAPFTAIKRLQHALLNALGRRWADRVLRHRYGRVVDEIRFDSLLDANTEEGVIKFEAAEAVIAHYFHVADKARRLGLLQPFWLLRRSWERGKMRRKRFLRWPPPKPMKLVVLGGVLSARLGKVTTSSSSEASLARRGKAREQRI